MTDTEHTTPEPSSTPDPELAGAGLSATGRTAEDFVPGEEGSGTAYGAPGGTGSEDAETTGTAAADGATADGDAADGDAEGGAGPGPAR